MDERSSGLILRVRLLTDTSLIVQWLTPDLGRLATVAKGARRPKSPFNGKLDLFFRAEFSFIRSRRSELHTLREVALLDSNSFLRHNLASLQQAAYCGALIEKNTEIDTPLPEFYELLAGFLRGLSSHPPTPLAILAFETRFLTVAGLKPETGQGGLSAGAVQIINQFESLDWLELPHLKLSPAQTAEIDRFLCRCLENGFGLIPSGRDNALNNASHKFL